MNDADKQHVLIVDDNRGIQELLEQCFILMNWQTLTASNGLCALEYVSLHQHLDLIVLDIMMPEMDGLTFMQELRKRQRQIPIIVITASTLDGNKREVLTCLGMKHVLMKPFHLSDLFAIVKEIQQPVHRTLLEKASTASIP